MDFTLIVTTTEASPLPTLPAPRRCLHHTHRLLALGTTLPHVLVDSLVVCRLQVPKAFKVIPNLQNWEEILYLTDPDNWTPHAVYQVRQGRGGLGSCGSARAVETAHVLGGAV